MKRWLRILGILLPLVVSVKGAQAASVQLFDGRTVVGEVSFERNAFVLKSGGGDAPVKVSPSEIVIGDFGETENPMEVKPGVMLVNGTSIGGNVKSIDDEKVVMEKLTIPIKSVAAVIFRPISREHFFNIPKGETGGLLLNGDFFAGTIGKLRDGKVIINSTLMGPEQFSLYNQLPAIVLRDAQDTPARYIVIGRNGSRYMVDNFDLDEKGLRVKAGDLGEITMAPWELASLRAGPGRCRLVTELKPVAVEVPGAKDNTGALTTTPPEATPDRRGYLVTAPNAIVTYPVPPGMTQFFTTVSLEEGAPAGVKVTFAVYGDRTLLFRTPAITPGSPPTPLRVKLSNPKTLTFRVEPAFVGGPTAPAKWEQPMFLGSQ